MDTITVKYAKLKKIIDILEQSNTQSNDDVSFEFIVGSLFPNVLTNIKEEMRRQHALGYKEGLSAWKDEVYNEKQKQN